MRGVNEVTLIGNLGGEVQLKYTPSGVAVCTFNMATNESFKNAAGEVVDKVEWHRVTLWRGTAEAAAKYLHKGSPVYIKGKLQTRKYTDSNNVDRWVTEIVGYNMVLLEKGPGGPTAPGDEHAPAGRAAKAPDDIPQDGTGITDDDIPF